MNPRAFKEASALASAGHEVQVLGADFSINQLCTDQELARKAGFRFISVASVGHETRRRQLTWSFHRARKKIRSKLQSVFRLEGASQLGYFTPELYSAARAAKADYYIAHLEQGMFAGAVLLDHGFKVGIDMEDWFSEDLLPNDRKNRPLRLLRALEKKLLIEGAHATCPSKAMSTALAQEYRCRPPTVVYNAFPWADRQTLDGKIKDRHDPAIPSLHWFSQTLGRGRGLEDLLAALPNVQHMVEIHLRGQAVSGLDEWFASRLPEKWRSRVFIHGLVSNEELLSRIAEHDIGFAGEMKYCLNKELTVSNKILHYLLGGLAVVASDTSGQREVAAQAGGAVRLYPSGNAQMLARELNVLLASADELRSARAAALKAAEATFCWERQSPVLLSSINASLPSLPGLYPEAAHE